MKKQGLTLIELIIVITSIAILLTISIIGVKALQNSFANKCSPVVINSLLSSARAIAAARQTYIGVRFQKQDNIQYAILITHNRNISYPDDNKTIPFTALENHQPFNLGREDFIDDKTTIIFSSQGNFVRKWVKIFPNPKLTKDDIFGQYGLLPEDTNSKLSDNSFIIKIGDKSKEFFINSYAGTLIEKK